MSLQIDKTNLIVYSAIGLITIGLAIYTVSVFSDNKTDMQEDFKVPDVLLSESKDEYQSRLDKATANQTPTVNSEVGKDFDFQVYDLDSSHDTPLAKKSGFIVLEKEPVSQSSNTKPSTETKTNKILSRSGTQPPITNTVTVSSAPPNDPPLPEQTITEHDDPYTNIGISYQKETKTVSGNTVASDTFFDALLLSDTKIKDGTQMVFILSKDIEIQGIKFRKMSRIFAVAQYRKNNVDVLGNLIQNTDGKKYPIALVGHNENYQKGIFNNSKVDQEINEGTNELVDDMVTIPSSNVQFVSSVLNSAGKATKDVFKKDPEINISEGYRMYFKPVN